jgi:hypothetical protein
LTGTTAWNIVANEPKHKRSDMDSTAALNILTDALDRCRNEDMRTVEVFAALDNLAANASTQWPFEEFRKALDSDNEEGRWQNLNASLNAVRLAVGRLV